MIVIKTPPIPVTKANGYGEVIVALNNLTQSFVFDHMDKGTTPSPSPTTFSVKSSIPEVSLVMELQAHVQSCGCAVHNETKQTIGLGSVDNFATATPITTMGNADDLFVTPQCVNSVVGVDTASFNEDNYLPKGSIPVASGQDYLFGVKDIMALDNASADADYALKDRYFNGMAKIVLNHDRIVIIPNQNAKPGIPSFGNYGWAFTSTSISNDVRLNFFQDRLSVPFMQMNGFSNEGYGDANNVVIPQTHNDSEIDVYKAVGTNKSRYIMTDPNSSVLYGLSETFSASKFTLSINRHTLNKETKECITDNTPLRGVYKGFDGDEEIASLSTGISFDITKLVTLSSGINAFLGMVGFSPAGLNVSLGWEVPGKTFVGLFQARIRINKTPSFKWCILKVALRFSIKEDGSLEITHLPQQKKAVVDSNNNITGNNVVFLENDFRDKPFHPSHASGVFSPFGGHYVAYSNLGGLDLCVKYFKHSITNIVDYINNFHIQPEITDEITMHIPRACGGYLGYNFSRFIPLDKDSFLVCKQDQEGKYRQFKFEWLEGLTLKSNSFGNVELPKPDKWGKTYYPLPFGIISQITNGANPSVTNTAYVLCKENGFVGRPVVNFSSTELPHSPGIRVNELTKIFLDGVLNSAFKDEINAKFVKIDDCGDYEWRLYLVPNGQGFDVFIIYTDNFCAVSVYRATGSIDSMGFLTVTNAIKIDTKFTVSYPTKVFRGDIDSYDVFTHYDLGITTVGNNSTLLFNNVLGIMGGDLLLCIANWKPGVNFPATPAIVVKDNLSVISRPDFLYGLYRRGQVACTIKLLGDNFLMTSTALGEHKKPTNQNHNIDGLIYFDMPLYDHTGAYIKDIDNFFPEQSNVVILPSSTRVMLNGSFRSLGYDHTLTIEPVTIDASFVSSERNIFGLTTNNKGQLIYLVADGNGVKVLLSSAIRVPSNYEVLYGVAVFDSTERIVVKTFDNYTVVDGVGVL